MSHSRERSGHKTLTTTHEIHYPTQPILLASSNVILVENVHIKAMNKYSTFMD